MTFTEEEKVRARSEVNKAVNRGELAPANSCACASCGHTWNGEGDRRIEYDHHEGYAPENWLNVQPLCVKCHRQKDCPKANQTHCERGHEFTEENTARRPNGTRLCRQCRRDREANRKRPDGYWQKVNNARSDKLRQYRRKARG